MQDQLLQISICDRGSLLFLNNVVSQLSLVFAQSPTEDYESYADCDDLFVRSSLPKITQLLKLFEGGFESGSTFDDIFRPPHRTVEAGGQNDSGQTQPRCVSHQL